MILLLAQHVAQFEFLDGLHTLAVIVVHLFLGHHLLLVKVEGEGEFVNKSLDVLVTFNPLFNALHLLHLFLSAFGIVPKSGVLCAQLLLFELHGFGVNVEVLVKGRHAVLGIFKLVRSYHYIVVMFLLFNSGLSG